MVDFNRVSKESVCAFSTPQVAGHDEVMVDEQQVIPIKSAILKRKRCSTEQALMHPHDFKQFIPDYYGTLNLNLGLGSKPTESATSSSSPSDATSFATKDHDLLWR